MHFDSNDLQQLTPEYLEGLPKSRVLELFQQIRGDLIQAQDRLNQNPDNSSKPPSSRAPWEKGPSKDSSEESPKEETDDQNDPGSDDSEDDSNDNDEKQNNEQKSKERKKRKPGKQKGAKGFGRTQKLQITETVVHKPCSCKGCSGVLDEKSPFTATGGHYTIDVKFPEKGMVGLQGVYIKHIYGEVTCECGFKNKTSPKKVDKEPGWDVALGEWRLIGPQLLYDRKTRLDF